MFALGAVTVFPWLCFITAADYYSEDYGSSCMFYFAVANMAPLACTTIYLTFNKITCSLISRIRMPLVTIIFFLAAIPVVNRLQSEMVITRDVGFVLTLTIIGIVAAFDAVMQNAVFGLVGSMVPHEGPGYIISLTTGQRSAGLIVVIIRVATKLTAQDMGPNGAEISTMIYFVVSRFCVKLTFFAFIQCAY